MALKTTRWNILDHLKTKDDVADYLDAVLEDGDPDLLKDALGAIARSKGMTEVAREAGLGRSRPLSGAVARWQSRVRHGRQCPQGAGTEAVRHP
jgi:probable addiction module antidote protein